MHVDPLGRYLILHLSLQDKSYWIGNIYAPTQQYELEQISTLNKVEEILMGVGKLYLLEVILTYNWTRDWTAKIVHIQ